MAKTNNNGYFCDYSCGMESEKCQIFFCAGCPASGIRLEPNKEYPEYVKHSKTVERNYEL